MHIRRWGVASSGLDPLLNRISRNLLIDRYRRVTPHLVPLDSADEVQDPTQDPSEEVARRQRRSAVHSAIRSLPTRHQTAITYSLSGLTPEEVGKQMGIGRNAADALLHRARRSLREHLAPVRDGMWGLALGVRMRWDRLTRRGGVETRFAETSIMAATNSAMGVATAAIVAVLAVTGGGSSGTPAFARSGFGGSIARIPASAQFVGSGSAAGGSGSLPPSSTVRAYQFGLAHGTYSDKGTDSHVTVPAPGDDPKNPMLDLHYQIFEQPRDPNAPTPKRQACKAFAKVCGLA